MPVRTRLRAHTHILLLLLCEAVSVTDDERNGVGKKSGNHFSPRDDDDDVPSVDQSSLQAKSRAVESCGRARFVVFSRNISRAVVPSRDFPRVWVRRFRREWPYPGSLFSRNFPTRSPRVVPQRVSVLKKEEREKKVRRANLPDFAKERRAPDVLSVGSSRRNLNPLSFRSRIGTPMVRR